MVHGERHGHLKRPVRVDASRTGAVIGQLPIARAIPAGAAAADATAEAVVVLRRVQRGVPGFRVGLHDVDFSAAHTTNCVGIAVVVPACRFIVVLVHGGEVEGRVAAAGSLIEVNGVAHRLAQQFQSKVLLAGVEARCASVCEVRTAVHVAMHLSQVGDRHVVPAGGHHLHIAVTPQGNTARALGGPCGRPCPRQRCHQR
mmetsp:Transcript_29533/g.75162  ORF Transcript_29533/g.75162 Transcript_29533/m.75162 type:complete len:200 (-) Transcript_29533:95-694(-)